MDYVKISRKILEWEWYTDVNTKVLFLHILLKANWKDGRFQGTDVPRGSFVTSQQNLAAETGLTIKNVRTALKHLENTGEVAVNRQSGGSQVATIEEGKKGRKEEYNKSPKGDYESRTPESSIYATIRELYNSVCGSYPRLVKMSDARKKAINARLKTGYTLDDFRKLFEKAEASDFLKGANKRNWSATFDWMICDSNMAKVLDGNYDPKDQGGMNDEPEPTNSVQLW